MSNRESIINAVVSALQTGLSVVVERNADRPVNIPSAGYVIVRDASPVIEEVTLGNSVLYFMRLNIPIEVYVQREDEIDRSQIMDSLCDAVSYVVGTNYNIMSLVNFIEVTTEEIETLYTEGSTSVKAAQMGVSVDYDALTALG